MHCISCGLLAAIALSAQTPTFEVASLKRNEANKNGWFAVSSGSMLRIAGNRVTSRSISLEGLIVEAYDIKNYQLAGLPPWGKTGPGSDTYDLEAKTGDSEPATLAKIRPMLQALLADRFQLKLHRETREMAVYDLTIDKGGLKIKPLPQEAPADTADPATSGKVSASAIRNDPPRTDFSGLVRLLALYVDRPLIDKTGLSGRYEYDLSWMGPDYAATRQQFDYLVPQYLGLRFEQRKDNVEVLVIDHAERPSAN